MKYVYNESVGSRFHKDFCAIYEASFPLKTIKINYRNRKPWLTEDLKKSIKLKNKLYHQQKANQNMNIVNTKVSETK